MINAVLQRSISTDADPCGGIAQFVQSEEMSAPSDNVLQKIAAGDSAAVNECVEQYGALIWSLARRYLGNEADAEDAVQEIFIELWTNASRFDPSRAKEITFISTIARRRLIDRLRAKGRRPPTEEFDESSAQQPVATPSMLEDEADVVKVERVLAKMKPQQRDILAMSLYQGYSHSEIAERTDLPLGTVKTNVRRGLLHIRDQLRLAEEDDAEALG